MTGSRFGNAPDDGRTEQTFAFEHVMSDAVSDDAESGMDSKDLIARIIGHIGERYELHKVLGAGAFGVVYKAWDKSLERLVALKILKESVSARANASERFLTEARAMAAITNDHVMPILDYGVEQGQAYIAMPLLGGETLATRIEREGALTNAEIARIGREIASGLAAIHAKGFLHRDLKPVNIWLEAGSGRVRILDFGLAEDPLHGPRSLNGTPAYMSPEQVACRPLDSRSDLFSLGSSLFCCATGRAPFGGTSLNELLEAVSRHEPPSLLRLNPGVSPQLCGLIEHLMRKDPELRPGSAWEVIERLAETASISKSGMNRRGLLWATVPFSTFAAIMALGPLFKPGKPGAGERPKTKEIASVPEKLRVESLNVYHHAAVDEDRVVARGIIGEGSFEIHLDDEIDVRAKLNRPAYCYLIIFRPDGQDAVLYPQDPEDVPELTDTPEYPTKRVRERYFLEEKEKPGLWMVAAFVSGKPLPSYSEWRKGVKGSPWKPEPNPGKNLVAMHDGTKIRALDRRERAGKVSRDKSVGIVADMMDWFSSLGADATAAVGFAVENLK